MAVRGAVEHSGVDDIDVQTRELRSGRSSEAPRAKSEVAGADFLFLDVLEVDDRRRALAGIADLGRSGGHFARPGMRTLAGLDPAVGEPRDTRAREVGRLVPATVAVREHVEAVGSGLERVRLALAPA